MKLAEFNGHCAKCPEKTETPVFDQMVHLRGFPGFVYGKGELPQHVQEPVKVIEGSVVALENS